MISSMTLFGLAPLLSSWLGAAVGQAADVQPVRRMVVRDELIIHIPIARRPAPVIEWIERKGPKCLPASMIAGASMSAPSSIDFVMRNRQRVRARLDSDCAGLDFYGGFYVEPEDRAVCARREEIRVRSGSSCRIDRFRILVPRIKR